MKLKNDEMTKYLYYSFKLKILFPLMNIKKYHINFSAYRKNQKFIKK